MNNEARLRRRVVEVLRRSPESARDGWTIGSGLLIGDRLVLTAAHLVEDGILEVRGVDKIANAATPYMVCDLRNGEPDLALLQLEGDIQPVAPRPRYVAVDRDSDVASVVNGCWAVGYPEFQMVLGPDGKQIRDTAQVNGEIPTGENLYGGLLTLRVTSAPRRLPPPGRAWGKSEWAGMSGAAVFAGDRIVGVITDHHPRRGESTLTVTPITSINDITTADLWRTALDLRLDDLHLLPPRNATQQPAYHRTLAELADRTPILTGREAELAAMWQFASTGGPYVWYVAGPWAGKTALAAHLVRSCPADVDCVAYFLQRRVSDADSAHLLAAVIPQLAWLLNRDVPDRLDAYSLTALWDDAVQRANELDRYLLLVVDGLDEDVRPPGMPSVVAMLPTRVGPRASVLVLSRPQPQLPPDVHVEHPIHSASRIALTQTAEAKRIEYLAEQDLRQILVLETDRYDRRLVRTVLGTLTAAAGALTPDQIGEIAGLDSFDVEEVLTGQAARVTEVTAEGHRFAHQTLLDICRDSLFGADRLRQYYDRLDHWVHLWRTRRWPAGAVPPYLSESYPANLLARGLYRKLNALLTEPGWIEASIARLGIDRVYAMLRTAAAASMDPTVALVMRLLDLEGWSLRPPHPVTQTGYIPRQLYLCALRTQEAAPIVADWRRRAEAAADPPLCPLWLQRETRSALIRINGEHQGTVFAAVVTKDGNSAISGGRDRLIRLWSLSGEIPPRVIGAHTDTVRAIALVPGGNEAITCGDDGRLHCLHTAGLHPPRVVGHLDGKVFAVAVTHDGQYAISGGEDGTIHQWSLYGRAGPTVIDRMAAPVRAIAIAPDGETLAVGSDGGAVHFYQTTRVSPSTWVRTMQRNLNFSVRAIAMAPDSRSAFIAGDGGLFKFEYEESQEPHAVQSRHSTLSDPRSGHYGSPGRVVALALTPEGGLAVTGGDDELVRVWDLSGCRETIAIGHHHREVYAVSITPDGRYAVTGGSDQMVRVWDLNKELPPRNRWAEGVDGVETIQLMKLSPDGSYVVTLDRTGSLQSWSTTQLGAVNLLGRHDRRKSNLAFSPDGRYVIGAAEAPNLTRWSLRERDDRLVLGNLPAGRAEIHVTPDGRTVAVADGQAELRVFDVEGERRPRTLGALATPYSRIRAMPDSERILEADRDGLYMWTMSGSRRRIGIGSTPRIDSLSIVPDGQHAVISTEAGVGLWNLETGRPTRTLIENAKYTESPVITRDGRYAVIASSGGRVDVCPLFEDVRAHTILHDDAWRLALSTDGRRLITSGRDGIIVWQLDTGVEQGRVALMGVDDVAANDTTLVSTSRGLGLTFWRLTRMTEDAN